MKTAAKEAEWSDDLEEFYSENYSDFNFWCDECSEGRLEPMMNYAYPIYCDVTEENRKVAADCGLFLFEHPRDEETYMSLMGGGMDLSPNILLAYLNLTGRIPIEWTIEFRQDYRAYVSEKDHKRIAKACYEEVKHELDCLKRKKKALSMFIYRNRYMKKRLDKKRKEFNDNLKSASDVKEPMIKAALAMSAFGKATEEVVD